MKSNSCTERNMWQLLSSKKLKSETSLTPLDSTVPQKSIYLPSLIYFLQFSLDSSPLHHFTEILLSRSLITSALLNPMTSFQLTSYLTHQQQLRLVTFASLKRSVPLETRLSHIPTLWSIPQSPLLDSSHFPTSEGCCGP